MAREEQSDERPGSVLLGRFRLERVVGRGGMGVVWAAVDSDGQKRAIKLVHARKSSDPTSHQRLVREAQAASAVRHPNVARVYEVCELPDGRPFIVMELLEGVSLATRIRRCEQLSLGETSRILGEVCAAVEAAHESGIVHRDLKPDNVFLAAGDGQNVTKVLDFGIAKRILSPTGESEASLTTTGGIIGTPHYMAPEQIFGDDDVDGRADVWAIGIILHECITGRRPTQASGLGGVIKIVTTETIPPLDGPEDLAAIAEKMLARKRDERPTVSEVRAVLSRYATDEEAIETAPPSTPTLDTGEARVGATLTPTTSKKMRAPRPRSLVWIGIVVAGGVALASARLLQSSPHDAAPATPSSPAPSTTEIPAMADANSEVTTDATAPLLPIPSPTSSSIVRGKVHADSTATAPTATATTATAARDVPRDAGREATTSATSVVVDSGFDLPLSAVRH